MDNKNKLLDDLDIPEDIKNDIREHINSRIISIKESFAKKYDNDKQKILKAMDCKLNDVITNETRNNNAYKLATSKKLDKKFKMLEAFCLKSLNEEITELRNDFVNNINKFGKISNKTLKESVTNNRKNVKGIENFIVKKLSDELVKFVNEKNNFTKNIKKNKARDIKNLREEMEFDNEEKIDKIVESEVRSIAKKIRNDYSSKIDDMKNKYQDVVERYNNIRDNVEQLIEERDYYKRAYKIEELVKPLNNDQKKIIRESLKDVELKNLEKTFNNLVESNINNKKPLNEKVLGITNIKDNRIITGDKKSTFNKDMNNTKLDEDEELKKVKQLAGIKDI